MTTCPTHLQQLRAHVGEVRRTASEYYLGSYLFRYSGDIEQADKLYANAASIDSYANKVAVLVSDLLLEQPANDEHA